MEALAKVARGEGHLELIEVPDPDPGPEEVLIDVVAAGICGSDVGIFRYEQPYHFMKFPRVLGHEYAGEITAVGEHVTEFEVGDCVVERPLRTCLSCYQCRVGDRHLCQNGRIPGVHVQGAFAPRISAPTESLVRIPDRTDPMSAVIAEPVGVAVRAVTHHSRVSAGDAVLVQGPGPIGLLTAKLAQIQGGEVVISGVERDADYRLPNAAAHGLRTVNASAETVQESAPERGFDVVFDATGHPSGLETANETVSKGGQVVVIGQTGIAEVDVSGFVRAEVELRCTYSATSRDFERSLELLGTGRIDADAVIDRRASLQDATEVFEEVAAGRLCKPLIEV